MSSYTFTGKSSSGEITQESNCVINIDYAVQDEKISFEVFRSIEDPKCVYRKRFSLRKSKSCNHIKNEKHRNKNIPGKMFEVTTKEITEKVTVRPGTTPTLAPDNLGPPPFYRKMKECPVKDTTQEYAYKENYDVSSFKFPENTSIVQSQNTNYCCLDFDGTKSYRRNNYNLHRTRNKHCVTEKQAQSDINVNLKEEKSISTKNEQKVSTLYDINKFPGLKKELTDENPKRNKKKKQHESDYSSEANTVKLNQDPIAFEFVLRPKEEEKREKPERRKHKNRKIIVTSNTLQPSTRPFMKNFQQQTMMSDLMKNGVKSINEIYKTQDFRSQSMDTSINMPNVILKKKKNKKKMTMSVFPCVEIKSSLEKEEEIPPERPVCKKRPSIPRRRINNSGMLLESDLNSMKSCFDDDTLSTISRLARKANSGTRKEDELVLKEKITTLFNDQSLCPDYGKKIDELCSLITCLVRERSRSRSRSKSPLNKNRSSSNSEPPTVIKRENSFKKEKSPQPKIQILATPRKDFLKEHNKAKLERLKITHNEKDSVTIMETIQEHVKPKMQPQNLTVLSKDVLKMSPTAKELISKCEFKRNNSISTYPVCIVLPDDKNIESKLPPSTDSKIKKPTDAKRNCSSVTFSSQIAIIGNESTVFNPEDTLKSTLFPMTENLFKRSKTYPTKQEMNNGKNVSRRDSKESLISTDFNKNSNPSISSSNVDKKKEAVKIKNSPRPRTPGAVENCTFLSVNKKPVNKINSFQKRKEYYNSLKLKQKNKPGTAAKKDFRKKFETTIKPPLPIEKIIFEDINEDSSSQTIVRTDESSKSKIPVPSQRRKSDLSPLRKQFNIQPQKEIVAMMHTIETQSPNLSFIQNYPLEEAKVTKNPSDLSTLIKSYRLENVKSKPITQPSPSRYPGFSSKTPSGSMENNHFSITETYSSLLSKYAAKKDFFPLDMNLKNPYVYNTNYSKNINSSLTTITTIPEMAASIKSAEIKKKTTRFQIQTFISHIPPNTTPEKLSNKTISLYRNPYSFTKTETEYSYVTFEKELRMQSKPQQNGSQRFVYYSTKPTYCKEENKPILCAGDTYDQENNFKFSCIQNKKQFSIKPEQDSKITPIVQNTLKSIVPTSSPQKSPRETTPKSIDNRKYELKPPQILNREKLLNNISHKPHPINNLVKTEIKTNPLPANKIITLTPKPPKLRSKSPKRQKGIKYPHHHRQSSKFIPKYLENNPIVANDNFNPSYQVEHWLNWQQPIKKNEEQKPEFKFIPELMFPTKLEPEKKQNAACKVDFTNQKTNLDNSGTLTRKRKKRKQRRKSKKCVKTDTQDYNTNVNSKIKTSVCCYSAMISFTKEQTEKVRLAPKTDAQTMVSILTLPRKKKKKFDSIMLLPEEELPTKQKECKFEISNTKETYESTIQKKDTSINDLYFKKEPKFLSSELFGLIDEKLKRRNIKIKNRKSFMNICKRKKSVYDSGTINNIPSLSCDVPMISNVSSLKRESSLKYMKLLKLDVVTSFIRKKTVAVRKFLHQYKKE